VTQNCKSSFSSTRWRGDSAVYVYNYGNIDTAAILADPTSGGNLWPPAWAPARPPAIEIHNDLGETLLTISAQGDVEFLKNPNHAAQQLVKLCQNYIDQKAVRASAMQRSYRRGVEKCLRLARTMEKDQLIDLLEREISVRLGSEMTQLLKETGEE